MVDCAKCQSTFQQLRRRVTQGYYGQIKMLVCLAGFIVREGRVNFNFLRGYGREVICEITEMTRSIKAAYFVAYAFYKRVFFFFLIIRAKIFFINFVH